MKNRLQVIAAILLTSVSCSALAVPILWTVDLMPGVEGQMITGSFVYDQDTRTVSNVNIVTLPGEDVVGGWFGLPDGVFASGGAVYNGVGSVVIDQDGYLTDVRFIGSPVDFPGLVSSLSLTFAPLGNFNCFQYLDTSFTCSNYHATNYIGPAPGPAGLNMSRIGGDGLFEMVCLGDPVNGYPTFANCPLDDVAGRDFAEVHMLTPQVVPVPPGLWLFASALGVVTFIRRGRATSSAPTEHGA